jgi:hypothetical protein
MVLGILVVPRIIPFVRIFLDGRFFIIKNYYVRLQWRMKSMTFIRILSILLIIPGFLAVYMAKIIANRYKLYEKVRCEDVEEMTEDEINKYKLSVAMLRVKMVGFLGSIPGILLFIYAFK